MVYFFILLPAHNRPLFSLVFIASWHMSLSPLSFNLSHLPFALFTTLHPTVIFLVCFQGFRRTESTPPVDEHIEIGGGSAILCYYFRLFLFRKKLRDTDSQ